MGYTALLVGLLAWWNLPSLSGAAALVSSPELDKLTASWHGWSRGGRTLFHVRLVETMADASSRLRHEARTERDLASVSDLELCNYAGFLSLMGNDGRCKFPGRLDEGDQRSLSLLYVEYQYCGRTDVVRCNPLLYGNRGEHADNGACLAGRREGKDAYSGCCVRVEDEGDGGGVTETCNTSLLGNNPQSIRNFIGSLSKEPERLAKYLLAALAVIKGCDVTQDDCAALKGIVQKSIDILEADGYLQCQLPKTLANLGVGFQVFQNFVEDMEYERLNQSIAQAFDWRSRRMDILRRVLDRHRDDPKTAHVIETLRKNIRPGNNGGQCWRYVKHALSGRSPVPRDGSWVASSKKGFFTGYPSSRYARQAADELLDYGFIDITKLGYPLDPMQAPHGSVVVYRDVRPGKPGHIEIVDETQRGRRFCSDYCSDKPPSRRVPFVIMVPVSQQDRRLLHL